MPWKASILILRTSESGLSLVDPNRRRLERLVDEFSELNTIHPTKMRDRERNVEGRIVVPLEKK